MIGRPKVSCAGVIAAALVTAVIAPSVVARAQNAGGAGASRDPTTMRIDAPATHPTTVAVVPADATTPRGALKAIIIATDAGNADAIRDLMLGNSPIEERMIGAIANRAEAEKQFRTAAENAFGKEGMRMLLPDTQAMVSESLAKLDTAKELIDGDSARVTGLDDGPDSDLTLKRVNDEWKIQLSQFSRGSDGEVERRLEDESLSISIIREATGEVLAGKFKTAQEAGEAIRVKLQVAATKRAMGATSQPQTQPTEDPATTQPR